MFEKTFRLKDFSANEVDLRNIRLRLWKAGVAKKDVQVEVHYIGRFGGQTGRYFINEYDLEDAYKKVVLIKQDPRMNDNTKRFIQWLKDKYEKECA